jgi:hypothetical protein
MHSRWADISDGEGSDTESSFNEDGFMPHLPESLPETATSRSLLLKVNQNGECRSSPSQAPVALNAYAPEFLPTLSMECQIMGVGYCDRICEESTLESGLAGEDYSSCRMLYVPDECSASVFKAKKKSWKRLRPQQLDIEVASSSSQSLQANAQRDFNIQRRLRNIEAGKGTKEYQWHMEQVRLHGPGVEPLTPDPTDSSISKRSWDYAVRVWRGDLRSRYEMCEANRPEGASVASTEADSCKDSQRSEIDDSATASDDGSSASL